MSSTTTGTNKRYFWITIDILNMIGSADRVQLLITLKNGRMIAKNLTSLVYGSYSHNHCSQASAALAPMRRVGLVNSLRDGRHTLYELTELGHKVVNFVESIHDYTGKLDANDANDAHHHDR